MQDFKTPLRRFIEENFIMGSSGPELSDTDSFMERHIIDSTGFLELVMFLEETWGVTVEDDDMIPENLDSLDALQGYLSRQLGG
jgi:acyl carrier protein